MESRDWKTALKAYEEAAAIVTDGEYSLGGFLDGAALAAQELGRKNLPTLLERAWREAPSLKRLCRWLGSSGSRRTLRKRAAQALETCPKKAHRQRALLHALLGDFGSAAGLLARAPDLGWSRSEHPGHLVFPLFQQLLGGDPRAAHLFDDLLSDRFADIEELDWMSSDLIEPRLSTPSVAEILSLADVGPPQDDGTRKIVLKAMRKAAENRVRGVTSKKRRRYYGHAAQLVAACAGLDPTSAQWVTRIREKYRRFPALCREFDSHLGSQ